jgi:hypothetical protein
LGALVAATIGNQAASSVYFADAELHGDNVFSLAERTQHWNCFMVRFSASFLASRLNSLQIVYIQSLQANPLAAAAASCFSSPALDLVGTALVGSFSKQSSLLPASLISSSYDRYSNSTWSVGICSGSAVLMTDAVKAAGVGVFIPTAATIADDCRKVWDTYDSEFSGNNSFARVLVATFDTTPIQILHVAAVPSKNSVNVNVLIDVSSNGGQLFCGARCTPPESSHDILLDATATALVNNMLNLTIAALMPSTDYQIFCVTLSSTGLLSTHAAAIATRMLVRTLCCRLLTVVLSKLYVPYDHYIPDMFAITVDSADDSAPIKLNVTCKLVSAESSDFNVIYPAQISYISIAAIRRNSLVALDATSLPTGSYNVTLSLTGEEAGEYEVRFPRGFLFAILAAGDIPSSPRVERAQLSNDGSSLFVVFDQPTNRAGGAAAVWCNSIFTFPGAGSSRCQWSTDSSTITVFPSVGDGILQAGEILTLRDRIIRAACVHPMNLTHCNSHPAMDGSNITVLEPINPMRPNVIINIAAVVNSNDSVLLDLSASTGNGRQTEWRSFAIDVTSPTDGVQSANLQTYLSMNYTFVPPTAIPAGMLLGGNLYILSVTLCNHFNQCGQSVASLTVLSAGVPQVYIIGLPRRNMTRDSSLHLDTIAKTAAAATFALPDVLALKLLYTWSVHAVDAAESTDDDGVLTSSRFVSTSVETQKFVLPAYTLNTLQYYTIRVVAVDTQTLKSSEATVGIYVAVSDVVALIYGGSKQSVRLTQIWFLDGSGSYDRDQLNRGHVGMQFAWNCYQFSPVFSNFCPLGIQVSTLSASTLQGFANDIAATNSTTFCRLVVHINSRSSQASVVLDVIDASAPSINIATSFSGVVNTDVDIILQATVSLTESVSILWSVDDSSLTLVNITSVPPRSEVHIVRLADPMSHLLFLRINSGTLPVRSTLTFSVAVTTLTRQPVTASASIAITVNGPPLPGVFYVTPPIGIELDTPFAMTAFGWFDENLPIMYEFGIVLASSVIVIKSKSQTSYVASLLPAGQVAEGGAVSVVCTVSDGFASSINTDFVMVIVNANPVLNATAQTAYLSRILNEDPSNANTVKWAVSIFAVTVHARVDCSRSPHCSLLHRAVCSRTPNTCGICESLFLGVSGDSNTPCLTEHDWGASNYSSMVVVGCPNNCSNVGTCSYSDASLTISSTPSMCRNSESFSCRALCTCPSGYFGMDCSLDDETHSNYQAMTTAALHGLKSLTALEGVDVSTVNFWIQAVDILTFQWQLLDDTGFDLAAEIIVIIARSADQIGIDAAHLAILVGVIDTLSSYESLVSMTEIQGPPYIVTPRAGTVKGLIGSLSDSAMESMVAGQRDTIFLTNNFRVRTSYLSSFSTTSNEMTTVLSAPLTLFESLVTRTTVPSTVSYPGGVFSGPVGLTVLPDYLTFANVDIRPNLMGNISSAGLRIRATLGGTPCGETDDETAKVQFTLTHNLNESFGLMTDVNTTFVTYCVKGSRNTWLHACPFGYPLVVNCSGQTTYRVTSVCPAVQRVSQCMTSFSAGVKAIDCVVVDYNTSMTRCECDLCQPQRRGMRQLSYAGGAVVLAEATSLSSYSFSEYASVIESSTEFNSVSDLRATSLVIFTFAVVWLGTFTFLLISDYSERDEELRTTIRKKAATATAAVDERKVHTGGTNGKLLKTPSEGLHKALNVEADLHTYLSEFFSPTFSHASEGSRFLKGIFRKHKYLSVFLILHGDKKWIGAFALLTNRTLNMLVLAYFYNIQFPNDDGSCGHHFDENSCIREKSMFNTMESKCAWAADDTSDASNMADRPLDVLMRRSAVLSEGYNCVWLPPNFEAYSLIVITVLVLVISVPLYLGVSFLIGNVLLAPTAAETKVSVELLRNRRASAAKVTTARRPNTLKDADSTTALVTMPEHLPRPSPLSPSILARKRSSSSGQVMPVVQEEATVGQLAAQLSRQLPRKYPDQLKSSHTLRQRNVYSLPQRGKVTRSVNYIDDSLTKVTMHAHLIAAPVVRRLQNASFELAKNRNYGDVNNLLSDLHCHQRALAMREQLHCADGPLSSQRQQDDLQTFNKIWQCVLSGSGSDSGPGQHTLELTKNLASELELVQKEAGDLIERLRCQPPDHIGLQILELFVRDWLGRHSREAIIFSQHIHPLRTKVLMSFGVKCVTFSGLLLLDLYCIYSCILYARAKGAAWQHGWLYACTVNLFVDVFINQISLAAVVYHVVPNLIARKARHIKETVSKTIHRICSAPAGVTMVAPLLASPADYLFVSAHVARAFPDLLESMLVLSHRGYFLSDEQSSKWQPSSQDHSKRLEEILKSNFLALVGYWLNSMLLIFGSQPHPVQEIVIHAVNPALVSAIAFIGVAVVNSSFKGIPVGVIVVSVFVVAVVWGCKYFITAYALEEKKLRFPDTLMSGTDLIPLADTTFPEGVGDDAKMPGGLSETKAGENDLWEGFNATMKANMRRAVGHEDPLAEFSCGSDVDDITGDIDPLDVNDDILSEEAFQQEGRAGRFVSFSDAILEFDGDKEVDNRGFRNQDSQAPKTLIQMGEVLDRIVDDDDNSSGSKRSSDSSRCSGNAARAKMVGTRVENFDLVTDADAYYDAAILDADSDSHSEDDDEQHYAAVLEEW